MQEQSILINDLGPADCGLRSRRESSDKKMWALYLLWAIHFTRPEWLISHYVAALQPLKAFPTLLLYVLVLLWVKSTKKVYFQLFALFIVLTIISVFLSENTGRARIPLRQIWECYLLGIISLTWIDSLDKAETLINIVTFQYIYLALWGLKGGLIKWDVILNEEDAYGPLMAIGIGYCFYYYDSLRSGYYKIVGLIGFFFCIAGSIISFARGTFLSVIFVLGFLMVRSKRKIKAFVSVLLGGIAIVLVASVVFPDNAFWEEMSTISEGSSAGTGSDRKLLWTIAWEEFKDNPFWGVGPFNFGVHAPNYITTLQDRGRYEDPSQIWGRALHNAYFQILCEHGLFGFMVYSVLIVWFYLTNLRWSRYARLGISGGGAEGGAALEGRRDYLVFAMGIRVSMLAFLFNAFFYDLTYYNWFYDLIILNAIMYRIFTVYSVK